MNNKINLLAGIFLFTGTLMAQELIDSSKISEPLVSIEQVEAPIDTLTRAVASLMDDNMKMIQLLTAISEEADKKKQYATANLVQSLMETHGKFVWMLRSFLEG